MAVRLQIAGVGGHGVILMARVLCRLALNKNKHCVMSEVHGMSQRGGIVQTSVVMDNGDSAIIGEAEGDCLIATEIGEALRHARFIKEGGAIVLNLWQEIPPHLVKHPEEFPTLEKGIETLKKAGFDLWVVDGFKIAREIGSPKVMNSALLGTLARADVVGLTLRDIETALVDVTKGRFKEANIKALYAGYKQARHLT